MLDTKQSLGVHVIYNIKPCSCAESLCLFKVTLPNTLNVNDLLQQLDN